MSRSFRSTQYGSDLASTVGSAAGQPGPGKRLFTRSVRETGSHLPRQA